jgi:hypothetical protein
MRWNLGQTVPARAGDPTADNLRVRYERFVLLQDLGSVFFELAHVYRARPYTVCQDAVRRDLDCSSTADAVGPVVRELSQRLNLAAASCLNAQVSALQLVRGDDLHSCYVLVAALFDSTLDIEFEVTRVHCP